MAKTEKPVRIVKARDAALLLLAVLLEPARGGGLPEQAAEAIYDAMSKSYMNLRDDAFTEMLLPDILGKWAPTAARILADAGIVVEVKPEDDDDDNDGADA